MREARISRNKCAMSQVNHQRAPRATARADIYESARARLSRCARVNDPFGGPVYAAINLKGLPRHEGRSMFAFQLASRGRRSQVAASPAEMHLIVRRTRARGKETRGGRKCRGGRGRGERVNSEKKLANSRERAAVNFSFHPARALRLCIRQSCPYRLVICTGCLDFGILSGPVCWWNFVKVNRKTHFNNLQTTVVIENLIQEVKLHMG